MKLEDYKEILQYIEEAYTKFCGHYEKDRAMSFMIYEYQPDASGTHLEDVIIMYEIAAIACRESLLKYERCVFLKSVLSFFEMYKDQFLEIVGEEEYKKKVLQYEEIDRQIEGVITLNEANISSADAAAGVKSRFFSMTKAGHRLHVILDAVTGYIVKKLKRCRSVRKKGEK